MNHSTIALLVLTSMALGATVTLLTTVLLMKGMP